MVERTCACKSIDAYECWALRYGSDAFCFCHRIEAIKADGGPCECSCHDPEPDDDEEWP